MGVDYQNMIAGYVDFCFAYTVANGRANSYQAQFLLLPLKIYAWQSLLFLWSGSFQPVRLKIIENSIVRYSICVREQSHKHLQT